MSKVFELRWRLKSSTILRTFARKSTFMYLLFVNQKRFCVSILMKSLSVLFFCGFWVGILSAQPTIQWQKAYGGNSFDQGYSIQQTTDGGYIVAARTRSSDLFGYHWGHDVWILKLTSDGAVQWKKVFGGTVNEGPRSILQTPDGGYLFAGYTSSNDFDVSGNHGGDFDGWVVKLSSAGAIQWQKTFGGSGRDQIWSAQTTFDNGYILAGRSSSSDGDATSNNGQIDFWVIKLNEAGTIQWQKSYGGSQDDLAYGVKQTSDGGYVVVGETSSNDGDVTGLHGNVDFWVLKLSPLGVLEWQKTLGGMAADIASDVIQTENGDYIVVGYVGSGTGDVSVYYGLFDYWIVKLNGAGELQWERTLGGSQPDQASAIVPATGGGFLVAGTTQSTDWDVVGNDGGAEFWVVKINEEGELVWQQTYGGSLGDECFAIANTADNGYVLTGYTWSNDGDATGTILNGSNELWVLKLSPEPSTPTNTPLTTQITLYPNPAHNAITLQAPSAGTTLNVTIYDLLGRTLLREEIPNGGQLNIAALQKGVYFVSAEDGDGTVFRGKLEKE